MSPGYGTIFESQAASGTTFRFAGDYLKARKSFLKRLLEGFSELVIS
jgi:hypothetical protein